MRIDGLKSGDKFTLALENGKELDILVDCFSSDNDPFKEPQFRRTGGNMRKRELLDKYVNRPVTTFKQYDVFIGAGVRVDDCSSVIQPDEDGDYLSMGITHELMYGADVRVFIKPYVTAPKATAALKKIISWIESEAQEHLEIFKDDSFDADED